MELVPAILASLGVAGTAIFHKAILDFLAGVYARISLRDPPRPNPGQVASRRRAILSRHGLGDGEIGRSRIYCALMDWHVEGNVATLAAFDDGRVELYSTHGGGMTDGGRYAGVRDTARSFLEVMGSSQELSFPARGMRLPRRGRAIFWLVTRESTRTSGPVVVEDLESRTSSWAGAWERALSTLAELGELREPN